MTIDPDSGVIVASFIRISETTQSQYVTPSDERKQGTKRGYDRNEKSTKWTMLVTGTTVDVVRMLATVAGPVAAVNRDQTNVQANSRNAEVR